MDDKWSEKSKRVFSEELWNRRMKNAFSEEVFYQKYARFRVPSYLMILAEKDYLTMSLLTLSY